MIKLEGTEQLIKNIQKALLKNSPQDIRKACKRGAEMIVNAARSNIKHEITGTLSKSIKILPKWSGAPSSTFVGPVYKRRKRKTGEKGKILDAGPFYAAWVEYGTAAHNLGFKGKFVEVNGKKHPGARPKPYMRPAFDEAGQKALDAAMEDIKKLIEK